MKKAAILRVLVCIIVIFVISSILAILNFNAEAGDSPVTIWGEVYDSDGREIPRGFDGEDAQVIVEHDGEKTRYDDPNGIEFAEYAGTCMYSVTIPADGWDEGDEFWVWIDGREWGDLDHVCKGHDDTDEYKWKINGGGSIKQNVNTSDTQFVWDDEGLLILFGIIGLAIAFIIIFLVWKFGPWNENKKNAP